MRIAALDVGDARIGVAISDELGLTTRGLGVVHRRGGTKDLDAVAGLLAPYAPERVVVGLPLNMDGSDSPRTQSIRAFARNLGGLGLPILLWDERWSTDAVTRTLLTADTSRERRAELVDKMAAAYILLGAIDALVGII